MIEGSKPMILSGHNKSLKNQGERFTGYVTSVNMYCLRFSLKAG